MILIGFSHFMHLDHSLEERKIGMVKIHLLDVLHMDLEVDGRVI